MRKRYTNVIVITGLVLGLTLLVPGCKKQDAKIDPGSTTAATPAAPPPIPTDDAATQEDPPVVDVNPGTDFGGGEIITDEILDTRSAGEINNSGQLKTVYFDYNKSELGDKTRMVLRSNAEWLKDNDGWALVVQGHCDERGTIEYNLALGEKRAAAVREYLVSLGLSPSRSRIVSYGEERPEDGGHGEAAWAKNRRAAFDVDR
jgi:peptidoglycan-associated lipoprotein